MTEEEFAANWYPRIRVLARTKERQLRYLVPADDLTQIGMLGTLALFRRWTGEEPPPSALVYAAARGDMFDFARSNYRRFARVHVFSLNDEIDQNTPSHDSVPPDEAIIRRMDRDTALAFVHDARELDILERIMHGDTHADIGQRYGIHETRVSQLKTQAIARIRRHLEKATTIREDAA
jgi:RNA polymerase sigma factor (sigma-70 family)